MNPKDWNQSQIKPRPQCFLTNSISHTHAMFEIEHTGVYNYFFCGMAQFEFTKFKGKPTGNR